MPGLNGTGPMGAGPRTGRGYGYCGNGSAVHSAYYGYGRGRGGFGRGMGFGYGARIGYGQPFTAPPLDDQNYLNNELDALKREKAFLEDREKLINEQLQSLKKEDENK